MKLPYSIKIVAFVFLFAVSAFAQNPTKWTLESDAKGKSLRTGESVSVRVKAEVEGDWHLYSLEQPKGGPIATTIKIAEGGRIGVGQGEG